MSMTAATLGRLERVDLREVWLREAEDFTPWLAGDENIALLGDAIGIELEVEAQEQSVGPFRADILCKDTATDSWVLIENQLERTDHTHLGQLLTYAAGLQAVTIVWIAQRFTEEHRATLDWLNEITDERFNFFGLEIELWRIGSSPVAPKFNVVCKPNDWSKTVAAGAAKVEVESLTDVRKRQFEFWTAFRSHVEEHGERIKPTKPKPQHWMQFSVGRTGFWLMASITRTGSMWAGLGCNEPTLWRQLQQQSKAIDEEFGKQLDWDFDPERKQNYVGLELADALIDDRDNWPTCHKRLLEQLEALHKTLSPRVRQLVVSEATPDGALVP